MYCFSCQARLSDKESSRKFKNHEQIKNPEEKYLNLCNRCISDSDLEEDVLSHEGMDSSDIVGDVNEL